jgi:PAS domain S-box-containing protein
MKTNIPIKNNSIAFYYLFCLLASITLTIIFSMFLIFVQRNLSNNTYNTIKRSTQNIDSTEICDYIQMKVEKTVRFIKRTKTQLSYKHEDNIQKRIIATLKETGNLNIGTSAKIKNSFPIWIDSTNGQMLLNIDSNRTGKFISTSIDTINKYINEEKEIGQRKKWKVEGDYLYYPDESGHRKISFIRYLKDYNWVVGCGDSVSSFRPELLEKIHKSQSETSWKINIFIFFYILGFVIIAIFLYRFFIKKLRNDVNVFTNFFKTAQDVQKTIPYRSLKLQEFMPMAVYANEMLDKQTRAKEFEKLSMVASETYNAIIILDKTGELEWVNKGFTKLFGFSKEEFSNKFGSNYFQISIVQPVKNIINECIDERKPVVYETYYKNPDEEEILIQTTLTPIIERDHIKHFVAIITDQSELDKTRKMLLETRQLEQLGYVVRGISHEIGTPIALGTITAETIISELESIESLYKADQLTYKELDSKITTIKVQADRILRNMKNAGDLIKSYHSIAKDELKGERRIFNLEEKIKDIIVSVEPRIQQKNAKVFYQSDNIEIDSYPGAISQILINLILNSLTHGFVNKEGGSISLKTTVTKNILNIDYKDDGVGISKDEILQIFDIFYTSKPKESSGLGLSIIKRLIESIGGNIDCISELNKGVNFIINIPL